MTLLPEEYEFREMNPPDVPNVLSIIRTHNHDDFECATESYARSLNGQYVLTQDSQIIGVTGARRIPETDRAFWLSWTYLEPNASMSMQRPGVLFDLICERLKQRGNARKLFAMISPGVDSDLGGGHSYGGSLNSYLDYGFQSELSHRDYYDAGESMNILSLTFSSQSYSTPVDADYRSIAILDSDEIAETDDAYYFEWQLFNGSPSLENQIDHWIESVRNWEGRVIFVGIPANAETAIQELTRSGFIKDGSLSDFYEDGLDEVRLRFDL